VLGVRLGVIGPFRYCWSCLDCLQLIQSYCGSMELTAVGVIIAFTQQSIGVVRSYRIRGEVVPTILFEMLKQFEVKVTLYTF
jgi:hypothetical protein